MRQITITAGNVTVAALLDDSETARKIWDALPMEGTAQRWGEEIYFEIPVQVDPAPDAEAEVAVGDLGYWPVGAAFCIFFGPTPASTTDAPRAYSPVNRFGRVTGDPLLLRDVDNGAAIRVTAA